jgi:PAS domain S-box-containing protein
MSPSTYDILGYEPEEFLGRPAYEFVCQDDQADLHEFLVEYFANDLIASQFVIRFVAKDGRRIPCAFLGCNCYDFSVGIFKVLDSEAVARKADEDVTSRILAANYSD